jgi:hypothetical protein
VTSLLTGVETERAELTAGTNALIAGPTRANRNFLGLSIGAARSSVAYDTLTWMLPNKGIVDVPLSFETEAVVGLGREFVRDVPMMHVDLWAGKAWLPSRRSLAVADLWALGYASSGQFDAATLRASLGYFRAAARGFWATRLTAERLVNPDPDVRSFVTIDPTTPLLPDGERLAQSAVGFSVERDVTLFPLSRSWALNGALLADRLSRGGAHGRGDSRARFPPDADAAGSRDGPPRRGLPDFDIRRTADETGPVFRDRTVAVVGRRSPPAQPSRLRRPGSPRGRHRGT